MNEHHTPTGPVDLEVILTYFKDTGKYYSGGEGYVAHHLNLEEVWETIRAWQRQGTLPGLCPHAGKDFYILVRVPNHPHDHPKLLLPSEQTRRPFWEAPHPITGVRYIKPDGGGTAGMVIGWVRERGPSLQWEARVSNTPDAIGHAETMHEAKRIVMRYWEGIL